MGDAINPRLWFRLYNPSIAKFLSVDSLSSGFPWFTPYQFAGNTPIRAIDLDGLEIFVVGTTTVLSSPALTLGNAGTIATGGSASGAGISAGASGSATGTIGTMGSLTRSPAPAPFMIPDPGGLVNEPGSLPGERAPADFYYDSFELEYPTEGIQDGLQNYELGGQMLIPFPNVETETTTEKKKKEPTYSLYITVRNQKQKAGISKKTLTYIGVYEEKKGCNRYGKSDIEDRNMEVIGRGLTKDQARGAEQALIELNNGGKRYPATSKTVDNIDNSTDPNRREYTTRQKAGVGWLNTNRPNWKVDYNRPNPTSSKPNNDNPELF